MTLPLKQGLDTGYAWTLRDPVTKLPVTLTGHTVKCQIRAARNYTSELFTELDAGVDGSQVYIRWTKADSLAWETWADKTAYIGVVLSDSSGKAVVDVLTDRVKVVRIVAV